MKLQLKSSQPVIEATSTKFIEGLNELLSSSDSLESEEEEADNVKNGDTTLVALLRQAKISQTEGDDGFASSKRKNGAGDAPLLWMSSSKLPGNTALGVYKALFDGR